MNFNTGNAIVVDHVTKVYRSRHLGRLRLTVGVTDLTFAVREGELFGLLGLNGSGKTTTIKLILGLLFPTHGALSLFGHPLSHREARSLVGYLPEIPSLYRYLTAEEILRLYGELSELPSTVLPRRIDEALALVHLEEHRRRRLQEFSKGMLQRVGIAQALLHDPPLLIFDEPITGLDPLGLKEMRQIIVMLNQRGKTVFFSSHSISEVERICHRVGILVRGRLARILDQAEWSQREGALEALFMDTVQSTVGTATPASR
ncbi:MAG: ABC transporter ATP-binding protein [Elusimicrobia bacterium]|nr:ABC transporter ATP-binding protein [Elusimicrobiota bacterium]